MLWAGRWPAVRGEARPCGRMLLGVLAMLALAAALRPVPYLGALALNAAMLLQLWAPVHRADAVDVPLSALGLTPSWPVFRAELIDAGVLALAMLLPWAVALHLLGPTLHHLQLLPPLGATGSRLALGALGGLGAGAQATAVQLLGVALPEELFWRGYVQPVLEGIWPPQRRIGGVLLGRAALLTSALFAAGHVVGSWQLARLGPFVPALAFAWLRGRRGSLWGAIALHAACNLGAAACLAAGVGAPR